VKLKKYVPGLLAAVLLIGEALLNYGFLISNIRAPGTPFVNSLYLSIAALILSLTALIVSVPRVRFYLVENRFSARTYWVLYSVMILLSLGLAGGAAMTGSIEYTQHQARLN